jgi:hypothetical protein
MDSVCLRFVFLAFVLCMGTAGCSVVFGADFDARQCNSQADCDVAAIGLASPLVCEENICRRPACTATSDCPGGSICADAVCVQGDAGVALIACTQDSECGTGNLCGFDKFCYEKWGCIDQDRDWTADTNATYRTAVRNFLDITRPDLIPNVFVKACLGTNLTCTPAFITDSEVTKTATHEIAVPFRNLPSSGFIGSVNIEVDAGPVPDGGVPSILPAAVHFTTENPLVSDITQQTNVLLVSPEIVALSASGWGLTVDQSKATMILQAHDCGGRKAGGVSIGPIGESGHLFVPIAGNSMPIFGDNKTTEDGAALIFNLTVKNQVFVLRDEETGRIITDRISISLKGTTLNYFVYYPRRSAVERWMAYAKSQELTP